jgi:hypothetical protein
MSINYVNTSAEATKGEGWTQVADFKSKGTEVVKNGVKFEIVSREESQTPLLKRIAVTFVTIITAGLALLNESIKNSFFGKEVVDFAVPVDQLNTERAASAAPATKPTTQALKDAAVAVKDQAVIVKDKVVAFSKENPIKAVGLSLLGLSGLYALYTGKSPLNCTYFFKKASNVTAA